jgi:hypothetical protein
MGCHRVDPGLRTFKKLGPIWRCTCQSIVSKGLYVKENGPYVKVVEFVENLET